VKITLIALAAALGAVAGPAAAQRYYEDNEFALQLAKAMTQHDRSYCGKSTDIAIADLKALIRVFESKLARGVSEEDTRMLHGELVPWYGRLAEVYRKVGSDSLSASATSKAIDNWRLSDRQIDASTPDSVRRVVADLDAEHPCKR
jgi:hypothetical protein